MYRRILVEVGEEFDKLSPGVTIGMVVFETVDHEFKLFTPPLIF